MGWQIRTGRRLPEMEKAVEQPKIGGSPPNKGEARHDNWTGLSPAGDAALEQARKAGATRMPNFAMRPEGIRARMASWVQAFQFRVKAVRWLNRLRNKPQ